MRVGLLSDTHLERADVGLSRLLSTELSDAEMLLHAGDHSGDAVVEFFESGQPRPYLGVAGNMDLGRQGRALPDRRVAQLAGTRVGLIHGWGAPQGLEQRVLAAFSDTRVAVVVFGHSHRPLVRQVGDCWLVNPGSAFHPRGGDYGSVAVLTLEDGRVSVELRPVAG